ncbi:hypothetical protein C8J57DRAFT_1538771 [Mycena rebaudengoi]|nr:hypothetical protein C8J57DRAFT_1538771 [Mycena rebaudengoi]
MAQATAKAAAPLVRDAHVGLTHFSSPSSSSVSLPSEHLPLCASAPSPPCPPPPHFRTPMSYCAHGILGRRYPLVYLLVLTCPYSSLFFNGDRNVEPRAIELRAPVRVHVAPPESYMECVSSRSAVVGAMPPRSAPSHIEERDVWPSSAWGTHTGRTPLAFAHTADPSSRALMIGPPPQNGRRCGIDCWPAILSPYGANTPAHGWGHLWLMNGVANEPWLPASAIRADLHLRSIFAAFVDVRAPLVFASAIPSILPLDLSLSHSLFLVLVYFFS